jgi:hypothetical protein
MKLKNHPKSTGGTSARMKTRPGIEVGPKKRNINRKRMDHFSNIGHMLCKFPEKAGPWPIVPLMVKEVLSGPYPVIFPEITFPCAPLLLYYVSLAINTGHLEKGK